MKKLVVPILSIVALSLGTISALATTYSVTTYGADSSGSNDSTAAVQACVNAAITAGPNNTVNFPAGTYLISTGPVYVQSVSGASPNGLIITGASSTTTKIVYAYGNPQAFLFQNGTNVTLENMAMDSSALGFTQGTITGINQASNQVTVSVESGYPLLNSSGVTAFVAKLTATSKTLLNVFPDATTPDAEDDYIPNILGQGIQSTGTGSTGVLTVDAIPRNLFIGEKWYFTFQNSDLALQIFGNNGISLTNINFYGGGSVYGAAVIQGNNTGNINITNFYAGPPPYQSDRLTVCQENFTMNQSNRANITFNNCNIGGSWDDALDTVNGGSTIYSQQDSTHILVVDTPSDYFQVGDTVYLYAGNFDIYSSPLPTGITLTSVARSGSNWLLGLSQAETVQNPGSDLIYDASMYNTITLENSTFSSIARRVLLEGRSITVNNCIFNSFDFQSAINVGPFSQNVTIENDIFNRCQQNCVYDYAGPTICIDNFNITGNTFNVVGNPRHSLQSGAIVLEGVENLSITNNTINRAYGGNIGLSYDNNVTLTGNTFNTPGFKGPIFAGGTAVLGLSNISTINLSGNVLNGASADTASFIHSDGTVTGATGLTTAAFLNDGVVFSATPACGPNLILDVVGDSSANNSRIDIWPNGGPAANQQWRANWNGTAWDLAPQQAIAQRLDVLYGDDTPGTNMQQYPANFTNAQEWTTTDNGNGTLSLTPGCAPGLNLDVTDGSDSNGANVDINTADGSTAEEWTFKPLSPAPIINYNTGFSTGAANLTLNGGATVSPSNIPGAGMELLDGGGNEARSVYYSTKINIQNFSTTFTVLTANALADGFTFCIQNQGVTAVGSVGGGLGYQGVTNSVAIKFNFYSGASGGGNTTGLFSGGASPTTPCTSLGSSINLNSGDLLNVSLFYDGKTLDVIEGDIITGATEEQIYTVNIPSLVGGNTAYVGFTGGTGGSTSAVAIENWRLANGTANVLPAGQALSSGEYLVSPNGQYCLVQQSDGNLVLYNGPNPQQEGEPVWSSGYYEGTGGQFYTVLQTDGNLVTYQGTIASPGPSVWSSNTYGSSITSLQLNNTPEAQLLNGSTEVKQYP